MLSSRYEIHLVSPHERRLQIKTDRRDAARIVKEDTLGYLRRCYIPTQYIIEEMRSLVGQQMDIGAKISRVKNQVHALLERNMVQSEFSGISDLFGVEGLRMLSKIEFSSKQDMIELAMYLSLSSSSMHRFIDKLKQKLQGLPILIMIVSC
jgi:hypothetical protein